MTTPKSLVPYQGDRPGTEIIDINTQKLTPVVTESPKEESESQKNFELAAIYMRELELHREELARKYLERQSVYVEEPSTSIVRSDVNNDLDSDAVNSVVLEALQKAIIIGVCNAELTESKTGEFSLNFPSRSTVDSSDTAFKYVIEDLRNGRNSLRYSVQSGMEGQFGQLLSDEGSDSLILEIVKYLQKDFPTEKLIPGKSPNLRTPFWYKSVMFQVFENDKDNEKILVHKIKSLKNDGYSLEAVTAILSLTGKYDLDSVSGEARRLFNMRQL